MTLFLSRSLGILNTIKVFLYVILPYTQNPNKQTGTFLEKREDHEEAVMIYFFFTIFM